MSTILRSIHATPRNDGFTLIEVLVATLILAVVSIGTVAALNTSTRQLRRSGDINELNALIESDLAVVRTANDRLVCNDATTGCIIAANDPGATGYFPNTANQANIDFFVRLCGYRVEASPPNDIGIFNTAAGFATQLVALLPAADARLQRNVNVEDGGHRYTVRYTRPGGDNTILRQVTLVPATASWCPCVPSDTTRPCPLNGP